MTTELNASRPVRLLLVLLATLLSGCPRPTPVTCGPQTCPGGCCDSNGECQPGTSIASCGSSGEDCRVCFVGQTCREGACALAMTGGGSAGGLSSGGGSTGGGSSTGGGRVDAGSPADAGSPLNCPSGYTSCAGVCVDTRLEAAHCGGCGVACQANQVCVSSACADVPSSCNATEPCPAGFFCQSNRCVRGCRTDGNCAGGQICNTSTQRCVCPPGANLCGGSCVPTDTPTACGASCRSCLVPNGSRGVCRSGECDITCAPGFHRCGDQCVSDASPLTCGTRCEACPGGPNATPTCDGASCGLQCAAGFHACGSDCVSDDDPATCGTRCTPCPTSAGATATCLSPGAGFPPECGVTCGPGFARCNGACVPETTGQCGATCASCTAPTNGTNAQCVNGACRFTCAPGFHQCGSQCLSDLSINSCGTSCTPCSQPTNGRATCDGSSCGVTCNTNFHDCNGQCLSNLDPASCGTRCAPCPTGPVGMNLTTTCDGVSCGLRCATATSPNYCNSMCVADSVTTCGTACETCQTPSNGAAVCSQGRCDVACDPGFHKCGLTCVADNAVDSCGTSCTPCLEGPPNSIRTCTRANAAAPYLCGWACGQGFNRCPPSGNQCLAADSVLGCGPTCGVCSSATANERGLCNSNGVCGQTCITSCNGACVNVLTSATHCGACNQACAGAERCSEGECRTLCPSGVGFASMLPVISSFFASNAPLLVVDVDGDSRRDLLTVEGGQLAIRLGQASGTVPSLASTTVSLGITATGLVAGDLTGDGLPEIVAFGSSSSATVVRNNGAAGFTATTFTANPTTFVAPSSATIGEFTGAAPLDLLFGFNTATSSQSAVLFPGNGMATGNPVGPGVSANLGIGLVTNLRTVDLNGDNTSDLVATAATTALYAFLGTGSASAPFNPSTASLATLPPGETFTSSPNTPFPLEVGDVTGDGLPDAIVPSVGGAGSFQVRLYPMSATGSFGVPSSLVVPAAVRTLRLADVDGDFRIDLAVGAADLQLFSGLSGGGFGAPRRVGVRITNPSPQSLTLADLTGDGRPEIVSQNSSSSVVIVPNEQGRFPALEGISVPNADRLVAGDLNGDGLVDVVVTPAQTTTMSAEVFFGADGGGFVAGPSVRVRGERVAIGRLNADGFGDLVTIGFGVDAGPPPDAGVITPLPGYRLADTMQPTPNTIRGRIEVLSDAGWGTVCDDLWDTLDSQVACRSLGYPALGASFYGNNVGPLTLPINMDDVRCTGSETELFLCPFTSAHNCSHSEDVGLECATSGVVIPVSASVEVRFGAANGALSAPVQLVVTGTPVAVLAMDVDGDGRDDVVASTSSTIHWWRSQGSNAFGPIQTLTGVGAGSLLSVDVNNDGRRDLLAVPATGFTATPLINVGGAFVPISTVSTSGNGSNAVGQDLNNDSKIDLVVGNRVLRGDGAGGFVFVASLPTLPTRLALADLDNDAAPELLGAGAGSSVLAVLRGDALSTSLFASAVSNYGAGAPIADLAVVRLDGDAQRDLLLLQGDPGARFLVSLPGRCR